MIKQFTSSLGNDERWRFFGNVTVGRDVSVAELRSLYHGVRVGGGGNPNDSKLMIILLTSVRYCLLWGGFGGF